MIIDPVTVLRGVAEGKFLRGLSERELANPEGAGFDLRLGGLYRQAGDADLGVEARRTSELEELTATDRKFVLEAGKYYVATTVEEVVAPLDVAALVVARSTLYRSGVVLSAGLVAPGYSGRLTVGLHNAGGFSCKIELEARFIHLVFFGLTGSGTAYRGQWQGGRVAATESEQQV